MPFFLTQQLFVYNDAPDVPVNMVASYDRLAWWKKHGRWVEKFKSAQHVSQGVWVEGHGKFELQNFIPSEKYKLYENLHQRKFPATQY